MKRLSEIFAIQRVLFEDFQVERTELILTPQCVAYAAYSKNEKEAKFHVWVNARLLANRTLSPENKDFIRDFRNHSVHRLLPDSILTRIPGLLDYNLWFYPASKEQADNLYKNIVEAVVQKGVDRFRTHIGIKTGAEDESELIASNCLI